MAMKLSVSFTLLILKSTLEHGFWIQIFSDVTNCPFHRHLCTACYFFYWYFYYRINIFIYLECFDYFLIDSLYFIFIIWSILCCVLLLYEILEYQRLHFCFVFTLIYYIILLIFLNNYVLISYFEDWWKSPNYFSSFLLSDFAWL